MKAEELMEIHVLNLTSLNLYSIGDVIVLVCGHCGQ